MIQKLISIIENSKTPLDLEFKFSKSKGWHLKVSCCDNVIFNDYQPFNSDYLIAKAIIAVHEFLINKTY